MMANSDDLNIAGTAILTANLGRMLAGTSVRQMMVILDAPVTDPGKRGGGDFQTSAQKFVSSLKAD